MCSSKADERDFGVRDDEVADTGICNKRDNYIKSISNRIQSRQLVQLTGCPYFLLTKLSKSNECWRHWSSTETVSVFPDFSSSFAKSSLQEWLIVVDVRVISITAYRVISINFTQRICPTFHASGNTFPRSLSCVCNNRRKNANLRLRLSK